MIMRGLRRFKLSFVICLLAVQLAFGQRLFFTNIKEGMTIGNETRSLSKGFTSSRTSCLMNCLNLRCCFVQIKNIIDEWVCTMFGPLDLNSIQFNVEPESDIYSAMCTARDCLEWQQRGFKEDGIYRIDVNGTVKDIFCDMTSDGGGWTVFQRRFNGAVDFQRSWNDYKNGFGKADGEYWLGNDVIYEMTHGTSDTLIKIEATDFQGVRKYLIFRGFWIENEANNYKLHSGTFDSGALDFAVDWTYHNGYPFATVGHGNTCPAKTGGGWWFDDCYKINPNNFYSHVETVAWGKGMTWDHWKNTHVIALKTFQLSIKRFK